MKSASFLASLALLSQTRAHSASYKFPGYGFSWYDPVCAYACYNSLTGATLQCTEMDHSMDDMGGMHMAGPTTPECRASDVSFLTTLAYCFNTTCDEVAVPVWKREQFWNGKVTGDESVVPKLSYGEALAQIKEMPMVTFNSSSMDALNGTQIVPKTTIDMQSKFMVLFDKLEMVQAKYVFIIVTVGFGTPVLLTIVSRLPFFTTIAEKLSPYLIYPSLFRNYSVRPLPFSLGNVPTIGQALYISMFFILNLILTVIKYDSAQPHPWGYAKKEELLSYIGYRTGHIGYALLPLLILFSGRNNFLLWITNWPYSTYLLLHRWIARIFAVQAIVHSIALLVCYIGAGSYSATWKLPFWSWGIVATVLTCVSLIASSLYFRRFSYEVFLIIHILCALFIIVGCWYHVTLRFDFNFYDNWLFAACAVWFADRLMRVLRTVKNGARRAVVTEVGDDHVRIDIQGMRWVTRPGYVAYAYFPTINKLRPWENHPFSINSTSAFQSYDGALTSNSSSEHISRTSSDLANASDPEKSTATQIRSTQVYKNSNNGASGITLIVKKNAGLTAALKAHTDLLTLIDGPYPQHPVHEILECDRVLLIGGGIGITGLLAYIPAHANVKLAWSVKSSAEALVKEVRQPLSRVGEKMVLVGERLDVDALLRAEESAGYKKVGVVVCGPPGLCDDVRAKVAGIGRSSTTVFKLEVEAFSW